MPSRAISHARTSSGRLQGSSRVRSGARPASTSAVVDMGEDAFYSTFYCASVTRCFSGRAPGGRGDRTPTPHEQDLCSFWRTWEFELLRPRLVVAVGGLAISRLLGLSRASPHRSALRGRRLHGRPLRTRPPRRCVAERPRESRAARAGAQARPRGAVAAGIGSRGVGLDFGGRSTSGLRTGRRLRACSASCAPTGLADRLDLPRGRVAGRADRPVHGLRPRDRRRGHPAARRARSSSWDHLRARRRQGRGRARADLQGSRRSASSFATRCTPICCGCRSGARPPPERGG